MKKFNYSFKAVGSIISISIISDDDKKIDNLAQNIYSLTTNFENKYSRFKEDSMLSLLNKSKSMNVDWDFVNLLLKSKEIYELTNWYFNPLVNLSNIWYSKSWEENDFAVQEQEENLDFEKVWIYWNNVDLLPWMNLDFGAIGKWFLADKIKSFLLSKWEENFLLNVWGDITASGKNLKNKYWSSWIQDPFSDKLLKALELRGKSISTSWTYIRNWKIDNKKYHHILSPWKWQKNSISSVSIIDKYAYKTDSLATAILAMWKEEWIDFCKKNNIYYAIVDNEWNFFNNL